MRHERGDLLGWTRTRPGGGSEDFTADGRLVIARDAAGQSEKTSAVRYVRTQTSSGNPPVLSEEPETVAPYVGLSGAVLRPQHEEPEEGILSWDETFSDGTFSPAKKGHRLRQNQTRKGYKAHGGGFIYDKAADSDALRLRLKKRGIELICPHRSNRKGPRSKMAVRYAATAITLRQF